MKILPNDNARAGRRRRNRRHWTLEALEPRAAELDADQPAGPRDRGDVDRQRDRLLVHRQHRPVGHGGQLQGNHQLGDGTPLTAGTVVANIAGGFEVTGTHTYAEEGSYPVNVQVVNLHDGDASPTPFQANHPTQETLVSDVSTITADNHDPHLVNPWGIAFDEGGTVGVNDSFAAGGPFWVADNHTGFSSLYDGAGVPQPLDVATPALPTGVVFNSTINTSAPGFQINGSTPTFLFADQEGQIGGWTWTSGPPSGTTTVAVTAPLANYTGLTMATDALGNTYLYATDFNVSKSIDVYNSSFGLVGSFVDPYQKAYYPAPYNRYEPYNIQAIGGNLYVTYAAPNASGLDAATGGGFVDVFSTAGTFIKRLISPFVAPGGQNQTDNHLNAPWGTVQAPSDFGAYSNDLLIANHGDGRINAYNINTGAFLGTLTDASGNAVIIGGLRGLSFGNNGLAGLQDTLYYTAGTDGGADGTVGSLSLSSYALVADAPLQSSPDQPVAPAEGQPFTAALATFTDADPEGSLGPPSDYTAVIDWGDGTGPELGVISLDGSPKSPTFEVSGSHVYPDEGSYEYTVFIYDRGGSMTIARGDVVVPDADLDVAPVQPGPFLALAGIPRTAAVLNFIDENPLADPSDFSAEIDWGDGTPSSFGKIIQLGGTGAAFQVVGLHTYNNPAVYKISVHVFDQGGSQLILDPEADVEDDPLTPGQGPVNQSAVEFQPFTGEVATFTYGNPLATPEDLMATIDWGPDATGHDVTSAGTILRDETGTFHVVGTHTFDQADASQPISVLIQDLASLTPVYDSSGTQLTNNPLKISGSIDVAAAGINAQGAPFIATEGSSSTTTVASFTDPDPLAEPGDFVATINWGDGTSSPDATITQPGSGTPFDVEGTHVYTEEGKYLISISVSDAAGGPATG